MGWAIKLAPHIHMDEYKRGRLKNTQRKEYAK